MGNSTASPNLVLDGEKCDDHLHQSKKTFFLKALMQGNLQKVKEYYYKGLDLDTNYDVGQTVLQYASFKGYTEIVDFLLQQGASTSICDANGNFPIHVATSKGQTKIIEKLIQYGANTNILNKKNLPPLYYSVSADHLETTSLLIQNGANINAKTKENYSLLYIACLHGNLKMVELLINNGAVVNVPMRNGVSKSPIYIAANKGYYKIVSLLIQHGARLSEDGQYISPLLTAVKNQHLNVVDILIDAGADVNFVDTEVQQSSLHATSAKNRTDIMTRLIDHGAKVNIADKNGLTPLHLASVYGNIDAVKVLLNFGADATIKSIKGNTPLDIAKTMEIKLLFGYDSVKPSAPPLPEDFNLETDKENIMPEAVRELEMQLEMKMQDLCSLKERCNEVESEIEQLRKRIEDERRQHHSLLTHEQDHLECPICLDIPFSPTKIFQCEQGHIFCEICYNKGLTFCPECRVPLNPGKMIRNRRLEEVIKRLKDSN